MTITRRAADKIAAELQDLRRTVRALSRSPQLAHSSIEDGSIREFDANGTLVSTVGRQDDGTHGVVVHDGPAPARPLDVVVEAVVGGASIRWAGRLEGTDAAPRDWLRAEVHASADPGFTPEPSTVRGTIEAAEGAEVALALSYGTYYVRLVAVTLAGKRSLPSESVAVTVTPLVDVPDLSDALGTLDKDLATTAGRVADAEEAIAGVSDEVDAALDPLTGLPADIAANGDRLDTAEERLTTAEGALEAAEGEVATLRDTTVPALRDDLTTAEGRLTTAEDDLDTAAGKVSGLESLTGGWTATGTTEIDGGAIRADTVTALELAAGTITAGEIAAGSLTSASGVFGTIDASAINAGTISTDRLNAGDLRAHALSAGKITADDIVAGTLTSASGVFGTVDASAINAGTLDAQRIGARTITAEKLVIGSADNLLTNPGFTDGGAGWGSPSYAAYYDDQGYSGGGSVRIAPGSFQRGTYLGSSSVPFRAPATSGRAYHVSAWARTSSTVAPGDLRVYVRFHMTDGSFSFGAPSFRSNGDAVPSDQWTQVVGQVVAPEGAISAVIGLFVQGAFTGAVRYSDPALTLAVGATLIEDGAVTTGKVAAGAITADEIAANSITAGEISAGTITASEIGADAITTAKLAADAVTANEIAADAVTANAIAAGTITADEIAANAVTADKVDAGAITAAKLDADAINGKTITGSTIQSDAASATGVKFITEGLKAYNGAGDETFSVDAATGAVSMVGSLKSGSTIVGASIEASKVDVLSTNSGTLGYDISLTRNADGAFMQLKHPSMVHPAIVKTVAEGPNGVRLDIKTPGSGSYRQGVLGMYPGNPSGVEPGLTWNGDAFFEGGNVEVVDGSTGSAHGPTFMQGFGNFTVAASNRLDMYGLNGQADLSFYQGASGPVVKSDAMYSTTYSGSANLIVNSAGGLGRVSSARRYKLDIRDLDVPEDALLDVRVRDWIDKGEHEAKLTYEAAITNGATPDPRDGHIITDDGSYVERPLETLRRVPGVIAEELEDLGLEEFVQYDAAGVTQGVAYDRLALMWIPTARRQRAHIESLEQTVADLVARVASLEAGTAA